MKSGEFESLIATRSPAPTPRSRSALAATADRRSSSAYEVERSSNHNAGRSPCAAAPSARMRARFIGASNRRLPDIMSGMVETASADPPALEQSEPRLSYVVARLERALRLDINERVGPYGLTTGQYTTLSILEHGGAALERAARPPRVHDAAIDE